MFFFKCSLLTLSQDSHHIITRPPLCSQLPPTMMTITRGSKRDVLSHINPHSHHHIDVSTHDCRFRRRCMTNGGSRHVYVSSTGIDYAYYNDTGRNGSREWERQRKESTNTPHTDTRSPVAATPPQPYKRPRRPFTLSVGPGIYF